MSIKTIFALASGAGRCGVSIVRLSGPKCVAVYKQLTGKMTDPSSRILHRVKLYSQSRDLLDNAMAVLFKEPKSFTGEDVLELHLHGAPIIVSQVYQELSKIEGVRLAKPGEFSERAFHAGKLGLQDVEGLADLLAAETDLQRRQALWMLNGGARNKVERWRGMLIDALAAVEAYIDFSEDENIENDVIDSVDEQLSILISELSSAVQSSFGELIRSGYTVVIAGKPNAGKSSLFNELLGRKAAIVSPIAGTTRDVLQCDLDVDGLPVKLMDTAGLRRCDHDVVEREGVERAKDACRVADVIINVVDPLDTNNDESLQSPPENTITVYNKSDLCSDSTAHDGKLWISCHQRRGIDELVNEIGRRLRKSCENSNSIEPIITRQRHRQHLTLCLQHCQSAFSTTDCVGKAERLRQAVRECGRVSGHVDVEDVLDSLFKSFCIGK